jgi:hypothetical protein
MGREAKCTCRLDGKEAAGTVLLESQDLVLRAFHRTIPLAEIGALEVRGGVLHVAFGAHRAELELGTDAEKWAQAIRFPKGLLDKLGVKPGLDVAVVGLDAPEFLADLERRVGAVARTATRNHDLVFVALDSAQDLAQFAALKETLAPAGALWTVRTKGRAELREGACRAAAKAAGLVDVKVASFSATQTAEKYVIPLAARPR